MLDGCCCNNTTRGSHFPRLHNRGKKNRRAFSMPTPIEVCKVDVKKPAWEQPTPVHNRWHPGACQLATKCAMPVCVISLFTSRLSDSVSAAVPSECIVNRFHQELTESQRANLCKEQSPLHSKALCNLQTSHLSRRFRKTSFSAWKQSTGQAARSRTTTARMTSSLWT